MTSTMDHNFLKLLPVLIVIVGIMTISVRASSINRVGFDDPCSKTIKCKSQSWLVCNPESSRCDCAKPGEMIYDNVIQKCVVLIGERCKYGIGLGEETIGPFYEKLDCVDGAICDSTDGICVCPTGMYEIVEENKCVPSKPLAATCHSTYECNDTLICLDGKCDCPTGNMVFESTSGTCKLKAGQICSSSKYNCVNGSECSSILCTCLDGMYESSGACLPQKGLESNCNINIECNDAQMLSCINEKCTCRAGSVLNSEGLCELGYGQECSKEKVCSDGFLCTQEDTWLGDGGRPVSRSMKCLCPNTELQIFDGTSCVGVVGGPCGPGNGCIKNSHCTYQVCYCDAGLVKYDPKKCDLAYGSQCEAFTGLTDVFCDRKAGLLCKQNVGKSTFHCSCPNQYDSFDRQTRRCLRRLYISCSKDSDCESNSCNMNQCD